MYSFTVFLLGLSLAPQVFIRVMKPVIAAYYIDNSLVMNYGYLKHESQSAVSELDNLNLR